MTSDGGKPKQKKRGGVSFSNRVPLSEEGFEQGRKEAEGGSHAATQEENIPAGEQGWQRPYAGEARCDMDCRKYDFSAKVEKDSGSQSVLTILAAEFSLNSMQEHRPSSFCKRYQCVR